MDQIPVMGDEDQSLASSRRAIGCAKHQGAAEKGPGGTIRMRFLKTAIPGHVRVRQRLTALCFVALLGHGPGAAGAAILSAEVPGGTVGLRARAVDVAEAVAAPSDAATTGG